MNTLRNIAWIVVAGICGYVIYKIYQSVSGIASSFQNDLAAFGNVASNPFGAITSNLGSDALNVVGTVLNEGGQLVGDEVNDAVNLPSEAAATASIPFLVSQGQKLDAQTSSAFLPDYAPGGFVYNNLVATQGQSAANATYTQAQADYANEASQTSEWWNPLSWF